MSARPGARIAGIAALLAAAIAVPAWGEKARAKAPDSPRVQRLRSLVDRTAVVVDQLIADVAAAQGDELQLQRLGVRFQLYMRRTEVSMQAVETHMTDPEREAAQTYGQAKLELRVAKMGAALREIQGASGVVPTEELETTPEERSLATDSLRKEFGLLAERLTQLAIEARAAGQDEHRRDIVRQRLATAVAQLGDLLTRTRADQGVKHPRLLISQANVRLEPLIMRVDRLLRLGALPPCPVFESVKQDAAKLAAELGPLLAELALVNDALTLRALEARWDAARAGLDPLESRQDLTIDETTELQSLLAESVQPLLSDWKDRHDALNLRLGKP